MAQHVFSRLNVRRRGVQRTAGTGRFLERRFLLGGLHEPGPLRRRVRPKNLHLRYIARHFIDVAQTHDSPPVTRLRKTDGSLVAELAKSDTTGWQKLRLKPVELLTFKAADGVTDLHGMLHFPSDFRPDVKHPLLVSVYAGPETTGANETFTVPNRLTEFGFLVATFDSRSASGRC